jgi:hypothetical protein
MAAKDCPAHLPLCCERYGATASSPLPKPRGRDQYRYTEGQRKQGGIIA